MIHTHSKEYIATTKFLHNNYFNEVSIDHFLFMWHLASGFHVCALPHGMGLCKVYVATVSQGVSLRDAIASPYI